MEKFTRQYSDIITIENLLCAWRNFLPGKKNKVDVAKFQNNLMDNVFGLYHDLKNKRYTHGEYIAFNISDPKPRNIHKATVRDRLLHHLLYQELYSYFDKKFVYDSYSCRIDKGTHKAMNRFIQLSRKVSLNNAHTCFVLKGDIRKFFASINHGILKEILAEYIADKNILWLLGQIIDSFHVAKRRGTGLLLGNLTSQLLVNIYMHEFDKFIKHELKVKYYIRYADDFVVLSDNREYLMKVIALISNFLETILKLSLHPDKVSIKTIASGVDFLGWVHFPHHRVLRATTKKRMMKRINKNMSQQSLASYFGMLKHGDTYKLQKEIEKAIG